MRSARRARLLFASGLALLTLLSALAPLAGAQGARAAISPSTPRPSAPAPTPIPATPKPGALSCTGYPGYESDPYSGLANGPRNDIWPLVAAFVNQLPCGPFSSDQVHASLWSSQPYSAERWTAPLYLPGTNGTSTGMNELEMSIGVGMVVAGDGLSEWHQAFAEVQFRPLSSGSWNETLSVWGLVNTSKLGAPYNNSSKILCPNFGMPITYNQSRFCILNEAANGTGLYLSTIPANSYLNLTFSGLKGSLASLRLYSNVSSGSGGNISVLLNASNVANGAKDLQTWENHSYSPYYNSSCPDRCMLNWSTTFGLGYAFYSCPPNSLSYAAPPGGCDSYNQPNWQGNPPVRLGIPHFFNGTAYSGEYVDLAPESTSGACNPNAPAGTAAACVGFVLQSGGTSFYPYFTYDGSSIEFGSPNAKTTEDFGGLIKQYQSGPTQVDLTPFWLDWAVNQSRDGFIGSSVALNVSTQIEVWGSTTFVNLHYRLGTGSWTTVAMGRISGTDQDGVYNASVPTSAGTGTIEYWVSAGDVAGAYRASPNSTVIRGPLPTFTVTAKTIPSTCGDIKINGTLYASGQSASLTPGYYSLGAKPCYPYQFAGWSVSAHNLTLSNGPYGVTGTLGVSGDGTLTLSWAYLRPHDTITISTVASNCGSVTLNGSLQTNGGTVSVLDNATYLVSESPCASTGFGGWAPTSNLTVVGNRITVHGNGTLVAHFVPFASAVTLTFYTLPPGCGAVTFNGPAGYTSATTLYVTTGNYSVGALPCAHYGFGSFNATGKVALTGPNTIDVTGPGNLTLYEVHLTQITFETYPGNCGTITFNGSSYTNGTTISVANNSQYQASGNACAGYYIFSMTGYGGVSVFGNTGGFTVIVNGSGLLLATFFAGTPQAFITFLTDPPGCGGIQLGNSVFHDSNLTRVSQPSNWSITPVSCNQYGFVRWETTGGISIVGSTAWVNSSGSITAVFRPLVTVFLYTTPATCGSVTLNGVNYTNNGSVQLPEDKSFPISVTACAGYAFSSWLNSSGAQFAGTTISFASGAVLTAIFLPVTYSVLVLTNPASCGALTVGGTPAANGTVLEERPGNYSVKQIPCTGDELIGYSTSANLSISNNVLTVMGPGNFTANYAPVPPSVSLSVPASAASGSPVEIVATVATPVPPFLYTYTWSFGDGSPGVSTPANFTDHTYMSPGSYVVRVTVEDAYNRTANATATLSIVAGGSTSATNSFSWTAPTSLILYGIIAAALIALGVGAVARRRPPPDETPPPALAQPIEETASELPAFEEPSTYAPTEPEESKP